MSKKAKSGKSVVVLAIIAGAFTLVTGVLVLGGSKANEIARRAIERVASETLGVAVTVEAVDIQPNQMQVTVSGVAVGNPPGYVNPNSMLVGTIQVVAESLSPQMLVFSKVAVADLRVNLEIAEHATNLTDLRKDARHRAQAQMDGNPANAVKVAIRDLSINDARVVSSGAIAQEVAPNLNVGAFTLSDIGVQENGVLAEEAIAIAISGITKQIIGESAKAGLLGNISAEALNDLKSQLGLDVSIVDQAKENLENITTGIKDMLGSKPEQAPVP